MAGGEAMLSLSVTVNENGPDLSGVPEGATVVVRPVFGLTLSQEVPVMSQT